MKFQDTEEIQPKTGTTQLMASKTISYIFFYLLLSKKRDYAIAKDIRGKVTRKLRDFYAVGTRF